MGFLEDAASADGGAAEETVADSTNTETTASDEGAGEQVQAEPVRTEKVALPKPSRRQAAAQERDAVSKQIEALSNTVKETSSQYQARLAESQAEIARLKGGFDALIPLVQQRHSQQQQPQVDPAALKREAKKALDAGNFDEWDRLNDAATEMRLRAMIPQQQQYTPAAPQMPPHIQMMMMQHPAVVNAGDRGIQLAIVEDQKLALQGVPNTPERYQQAFKLAALALTPKGAASYSQDSRGALSGIQNARSSGSGGRGGELGVNLTAYELQVAEKCGMSKAEYAQYIAEADPKRLSNG